MSFMVKTINYHHDVTRVESLTFFVRRRFYQGSVTYSHFTCAAELQCQQF